MTIKILLADDHEILREGLMALLNRQDDMEVIGQAANGREALSLAKELNPDIVVMDVMMPDMDGIEATRQIRRMLKDVRVLSLSMYADQGFISEMLRVGASGFLLKDCAFDELVQAVRVVHRGKTYLGPTVSGLVTKMLVTDPHNQENEPLSLTAREYEVMKLLASGLSNRDISEELHLSVKTVANHRQNIMKKLKLKNVVELTRYAIREGLVGVD